MIEKQNDERINVQIVNIDQIVKEFKFDPAPFVPFHDKKAMDKVRKISGKDLEKPRTKTLKLRYW